MSVARDGSIGVFGVTWRRVEIDDALYVHESGPGDRAGILVGPFATNDAVRSYMVAHGRGMKDAYLQNRAQLSGEMGLRIRPVESGDSESVFLSDEATTGS